MTRSAILLSILFCTGLPIYAFAALGLNSQVVPVGLLGATWLILYLRRKTRFTNLIFFLFGLLSVVVVWAGASLWAALMGMIFALLAWDLTAFEVRLIATSDPKDVRRMELAHFTRLALVIGLGLAGAIVSDLIEVEMTLGWALIFALLGIWGISTLVYRLRSRE